jgi:hypothetical protein
VVGTPEQKPSVHAVFRGINEQLYGLDAALQNEPKEILVVCECEGRECIERIVLHVARYEELRADVGIVIVVPGHPAAGEVVDGDGTLYDVIRLRDAT